MTKVNQTFILTGCSGVYLTIVFSQIKLGNVYLGFHSEQLWGMFHKTSLPNKPGLIQLVIDLVQNKSD